MGEPQVPHIAVIGAGIVGVSTAIHLQRLGAKVTLVDRNEPGNTDQASYGNGGVLARCSIIPVPTPGILLKAPSMMLRADGPLFMRWSYLPRLLPFLVPYLMSSRRHKVEHTVKHLAPLLIDSVREHEDLAKGSPAAARIRSSSYMYLYENQEAFASDSFGWNLRREHGIEWETIEGEQIRDLNPDLSTRYNYSVLLKDHGTILDPGAYVNDLAMGFAEAGGTIVRGSINRVDTTGDGVVLKTDGAPISADKVVVAAGAWSHRLAASLGATVPLEAERGYHLELVAANKKLTLPVMDAVRKFVAVPMDEVLRFAGIVEFGGLDAPASKGPTNLLLRGAKSMLPGIEFEEKRTWMGHRPATVDSLPIIGSAPATDKVCFAYGHHHIGLTAGPITGRLAANHVMGVRQDQSLDAYRCDRY